MNTLHARIGVMSALGTLRNEARAAASGEAIRVTRLLQVELHEEAVRDDVGDDDDVDRGGATQNPAA
jgi:hypothetical protein